MRGQGWCAYSLFAERGLRQGTPSAPPHLERELGGAHHFDDVEGSPADVVPQHLQLSERQAPSSPGTRRGWMPNAVPTPRGRPPGTHALAPALPSRTTRSGSRRRRASVCGSSASLHASWLSPGRRERTGSSWKLQGAGMPPGQVGPTTPQASGSSQHALPRRGEISPVCQGPRLFGRWASVGRERINGQVEEGQRDSYAA